MPFAKQIMLHQSSYTIAMSYALTSYLTPGFKLCQKPYPYYITCAICNTMPEYTYRYNMDFSLTLHHLSYTYSPTLSYTYRPALTLLHVLCHMQYHPHYINQLIQHCCHLHYPLQLHRLSYAYSLPLLPKLRYIYNPTHAKPARLYLPPYPHNIDQVICSIKLP